MKVPIGDMGRNYYASYVEIYAHIVQKLFYGQKECLTIRLKQSLWAEKQTKSILPYSCSERYGKKSGMIKSMAKEETHSDANGFLIMWYEMTLGRRNSDDYFNNRCIPHREDGAGTEITGKK